MILIFAAIKYQMPDISDIDLLQDYSRNASEEAFAEVVRRHINLVYSTALRHAGIPAHAEEIAQAVFVILARKAATLRPGTVLEAWLYETTRLTSLSFQRGERRRQFREQEAYMQSTIQEHADASTWSEFAPLLDEAIARLGKKDREAVVLRFFKEKNLREVAAALNVTETAAQVRVHRALEKLRSYFSKRGVESTTAIIANEISANSVHAAPAALAKTISAVAAVKGATASTSTLTLIKGALKIMAWTNTKTALVVGLGILLAAGTTIVTVKRVEQGRAHLLAAHGRNNTAALLVASEFVEVPDNLEGSLDVQWQSTDSGGATAVLTAAQYTELMRAFKGNSNVKILGAPRIAFAPPMPGKKVSGTVSMTRPVEINGTNATVGTILNVAAELSPDSRSVLLNLDAEWRAVATNADLPPGASGNEVGTAKADAVATLTLNPKETILIRPPVNDNGPDLNSKSLLVFITPRVDHVQVRLTPAKLTVRN